VWQGGEAINLSSGQATTISQLRNLILLARHSGPASAINPSIINNPAPSPNPSAILISCKEVNPTTATASTRLMKELQTEERI
jgi:hypothetical protein